MMFRKICILRTMTYNRVTLSIDNIILHLVKKFIFCPTRWMNCTTDVSNTMHSDAKEKNNNPNVSVCSNIPNIDLKFINKNLYDGLPRDMKFTNIYLANDKAAKKFVALIKNDLLKNMSYVIELNPGSGLLTKRLLEAGVPFIHLYETNPEYSEHLTNLTQRYPNQLSLQMLHTHNISRLLRYLTTNIYKNNDKELLNDSRAKKWEDESCAQIIGTTTKIVLFRKLITHVIFQSNIMIFGRSIYYLAIPMSLCRKVMKPKKSTTFYIMFTILFNFQIFGTLDKNAFIPQFKNKNLCNSPINDLFIVIKVEPKSDLFIKFKSKKNLIYFWHFVRHHFYKPTTKVIPALEKIIPGCGVRLIAQNYNIYTEFGDLTPAQTYDLFLELNSWPEFEQSAFILSANDIKNLYDAYLEEENVM